MGKYTPEQIRAASFIERVARFLKGTARESLANNVFFKDVRVVCGRTVGASRKQKLRHAIAFGKLW